jgi:Uma2 family endonuclease
MYQIKLQKPTSEPLPTMYDLPSEDPEEPGLPDLFHEFQPKLLRETCLPITYPQHEVFIGADLNLYYDSRHTRWYKRPDWFLCLGVTSSDQQQDLRLSYVMWQEWVAPFLVVELLSPGTEDEDLGQKLREIGKPPTKWEVYEKILRVPFYMVFDRYDNDWRLFGLERGRYQEIVLSEPRFWFDELGIGLGRWEGRYQGTTGVWLRWYDAAGNWLETAAERADREAERSAHAAERAEREAERAERAEREAEREAERAEHEAERAERLAQQLRALGITPEQEDH